MRVFNLIWLWLVFSWETFATPCALNIESDDITLPSTAHGELSDLFNALPQELQTCEGGQIHIKVSSHHPVFAKVQSLLQPPNNKIEIFIHNHQNLSIQYLLNERLIRQLVLRHNRRTNLSRTDSWLRLSGWKKTNGINLPLTPKFWVAENSDPNFYSSLDAMSNPDEDFVDFAVHFLSNGSNRKRIKCDLFPKYQFMIRHFSMPIEFDESIHCPKVEEDFLSDITFLDPLSRTPIDMGKFDSKNIEGFEILFATPGTGDPAEVAGHLVLRVKLKNNPEAEKLGLENPNDLVLAFLADTREPGTTEQTVYQPEIPQKNSCKDDSWFNFESDQTTDFDAFGAITQALKGLAGGYQTTFERNTLFTTIMNYTYFQNRNLMRYRLNLSQNQKERLIRHLYQVKLNFKTKYYFFDRNCASVLVDIIANGVGDNQLADFNPIVAPPTSLLAFMARRGLVTQVFPSFHSQKKKAQIAQTQLERSYKNLVSAHPEAPWPTFGSFISKDSTQRTNAYSTLFELYQRLPSLDSKFYELGIFAAASERYFLRLQEGCDEVFDDSLVQIKKINAKSRLLARSSFSPDQMINRSYIQAEKTIHKTGSEHTRLSSIRSTFGQTTNYDSRQRASIEFTAFRQDLGSYSRYAMGRGTSVTLGQLSYGVAENPGDFWNFNVLTLRKFRDRLDAIPNYFDRFGGVGLGLKVLDFSYDRHLKLDEKIWIGGELLFNLFSSPLYNHFIYFGIGANLEANSIATPLRAEGLWSIDARKIWKYRIEVVFKPIAIEGGFTSQSDLQQSISYRWSQSQASEYLISLNHKASQKNNQPAYQSMFVAAELNRY